MPDGKFPPPGGSPWRDATEHAGPVWSRLFPVFDVRTCVDPHALPVFDVAKVGANAPFGLVPEAQNMASVAGEGVAVDVADVEGLS